VQIKATDPDPHPQGDGYKKTIQQQVRESGRLKIKNLVLYIKHPNIPHKVQVFYVNRGRSKIHWDVFFYQNYQFLQELIIVNFSDHQVLTV
jgi:hypothetical protein